MDVAGLRKQFTVYSPFPCFDPASTERFNTMESQAKPPAFRHRKTFGTGVAV